MIFIGEDMPLTIDNDDLEFLESDWVDFALTCKNEPEDADPEDLQDLLAKTYAVLRERMVESKGRMKLKGDCTSFAKFMFGVGEAYSIIDSTCFRAEVFIGPKQLIGYAHLCMLFWLSFYTEGWRIEEGGRLTMCIDEQPLITVDPSTFELPGSDYILNVLNMRDSNARD